MNRVAFKPMNLTQLTDQAIHAAILAGTEIRTVYLSDDFRMKLKEDHTPVTLADQNAHEVIVKELQITGLPVLSEEGDPVIFSERKCWDMFWLVDPLDGTKEFIRRNDEFTVNIALIQKNKPIAGVIYVPVSRELYVGIPGMGAWKIKNPSENCTVQLMQLSGEELQEEAKLSEYVIVVSRSHMNPETEAYIENIRKAHKVVQIVSLGSSLKICRIAEGTASIYPKFGQTMEWDTAAGHAIVKAAGKNIYLPDLKTELIYNKENLHNPHFIVV